MYFWHVETFKLSLFSSAFKSITLIKMPQMFPVMQVAICKSVLGARGEKER